MGSLLAGIRPYLIRQRPRFEHAAFRLMRQFVAGLSR